MVTLDQFHKQLIDRRRAIEEDMFTSPPKDWAAFTNRHGSWNEVNILINDIEDAIKGREDDQP